MLRVYFEGIISNESLYCSHVVAVSLIEDEVVNLVVFEGIEVGGIGF